MANVQQRRWLRILAVVGIGAVACATLAVLAPGCLELGTQAVLLPSVERRIGAEIRAPWVVAGSDTREVITFANVAPGHACAQAGIVSGDIVVSDPSIGALCKRLNGSSGDQVTVEVVAGGNGPPIEQRPRRQVTVTLP